MQDNLTAAMPMLTIMGWILFIYTSCLTALLRWGSLTALLVLLHASFMRPASELSWSRQGGRRTLGWSLAELYMGRPASGPGEHTAKVSSTLALSAFLVQSPTIISNGTTSELR